MMETYGLTGAYIYLGGLAVVVFGVLWSLSTASERNAAALERNDFPAAAAAIAGGVLRALVWLALLAAWNWLWW